MKNYSFIFSEINYYQSVSIDSEDVTDCITTDLMKAFVLTNIDILLKKLQKKPNCSANYYKECSVVFVVPQVSIFEHLLFIIVAWRL